MSTRTDTLLAQCILRAVRAQAEDDIASGRDPSVPANRRELLRTSWKATRVGSNAATLTIEWALALDDLNVHELGIEAFGEYSSDSIRTVYRRLSEFRRCWPEYDVPNELARVVLAEARRREVRITPQLELVLPA
jgi:predicted secreted protein